MSQPLLLEVGCEELPSSSLEQLGIALREQLLRHLADKGLSHGASHWFAAPRRLGVLVEDLVEQADDETREALGPPLAQAKDEEGNWSRAAQGFAAKQGCTADELEIIDTPKGQRLGLKQVVTGAKTSECLDTIANSAIADLPMPKRMRWGASRREFVRPVHWIVLMYGDKSGFGEVLGITSGNTSKGHRFHAPQSVTFASAANYRETLRKARVIADFQERCDLIREQVEKAATALGGQALIDEDLLGEVASLVEWPVALAGSFDTAFLEVPAEALISSMQSHQKYFPVVDADNKLMPNFVTVSNIESQDPGQVIAGNERVIRPRLADAAFFFEQDRQSTLASRVPRLGAVVFQKKLGSLLEKTQRIQRLAGKLAALIGANQTDTERAAELCKADLVSDMVLEFGDLQGIAGAYYARNDGENDAVADAIAQHYWPTQAGSDLPVGDVAVAVALADRLDTLMGIFGIGQPPTGSKDPFALRRASIAVLRIIIEKGLALDLRECLELAGEGFPAEVIAENAGDAVFDYMLDRLPALYENDAIAIEVFRAVRGSGSSKPADFDRRVRAVHAFGERPEAEALAAANKRVSNILAKAEDRDDDARVSADLLSEANEIALYEAITAAERDNVNALAKADYSTALGRLATLRAPVDAFFDEVMVNAEDPALKANRLALLASLRGQFMAIADISQLAGSKSE
ncbi:glycine--tRNA ligase subunit beta [Congregibacter litoralis]|uniref:Glycine--tRNA ligase beta subunit n=1 Tax=Congregibacter litoralis KT71 TaxID=314285 RepID=A4A942_9GAMM|nr:glycine--tRNA ligase subunit beta [Congregibacter litoralis]EAQ97584.1 glycyl-tRNA synthetase beta chain [Congregibacter litoralis KT71]